MTVTTATHPPYSPATFAQRVGISTRTAQLMRNAGTGPAWYYIGTRIVRYEYDVVERWVAEQQQH